MEKKCVYLSETQGIHDLRWRNALSDMGWEVSLAINDSHSPVVAGPLTPELIGSIKNSPNRAIGLSWGWDLYAAQDVQPKDWLSNLDGLVVDSEPTRKIAIQLGMNPRSIAFIPWGIELDEFEPGARNRPSKLSILSLRAHEPLYRIETILEAAYLLQRENIDCSLTVGNKGSLTAQLERKAIELGLSDCVFIGRTPEKDLSELFREHSVYVSAAETDGTSVTLLQALAMEIPVVVSNSPGNIAWLSQGGELSGRIFELGDPQDLALKVKEIDKAPDQTQKMAQAGRGTIKNQANWKRNVFRLNDLLVSQLK